MAVSTDNAYSGPYLANGATTVFPFTFTAPTPDEVEVLVRDADGAEVPSGQFSVTVNSGAGGAVTFYTAPASGLTVMPLLAPLFTQDLLFANGAAWLAEPVNEGYDRGAIRDQVLKREADRGVKVPLGEEGLRLPPLNARAERLPAFDAIGGLGVMEGVSVIVTLDSLGRPAGTPVFDILSSIGTMILDDGTWGGNFNGDDGIWG